MVFFNYLDKYLSKMKLYLHLWQNSNINNNLEDSFGALNALFVVWSS